MDVSTMPRNIAFAIAIILAWPIECACAQADLAQEKQNCDKSVLSYVGTHLTIRNFSYQDENGGVIVSSACKTWPKSKYITIAAFAYDKGAEYEKALVVALVENRSGKVVGVHEGAIVEDAAMRMENNSLRIDTARYDIAKNIRAFGVDVTSGYIANCGDGGSGSVRTLFVQNGNVLRPILEDLNMSYWRFVQGGNPGCMSGEFAAKALEPVIENIAITIGVEKNTSNGFANLMITASRSYDNGTTPERMPFRYELSFDGNQYPTEKLNDAFWKWRK